MPSGRPRIRRPGLAGLAASLLLALVLLGALIWFVPYLTRKQQPVAGVPTPPALFGLSEFALPAGQKACITSVTVTPNSRLAQIQTHPATVNGPGGPPLELVLSAPGYLARSLAPGGYPLGTVTFTVSPPKKASIGTACFINRGKRTVLLDGTTEPRTISRSYTVIEGNGVFGDITLTFLDSHPRSLLSRLGEVFGHASDLTDRLIPVWLIWILAVLAAFGVPLAVVAAFYWALRQDEAATAG